MDFDALKTEFAERGFSDYTDARRGFYVNRARAELDEVERWPYREASITGEAPLTVADLGTVEQVVNISNPHSMISQAEYGELVASFGDLSTDGTPAYFYLAWPNGVPTVATYPESDQTIGVQYWRVPPDLEDPEDIPAAPSRFHGLIVDIAVREAYRDMDNHPAAESLQAQIERGLARMRDALFTAQVQGPSFIRIVAGSEDW